MVRAPCIPAEQYLAVLLHHVRPLVPLFQTLAGREVRLPGRSRFANMMDAVIAQESGGRVGVTGPQTRYGQAQGLAQLLPDTARGVAQKLGVPWRPELMTGRTREAATYQRALGEAYLSEGIERTGNMRDALRYYHGGPNRRLWGPKTNAYADRVLNRIGR